MQRKVLKLLALLWLTTLAEGHGFMLNPPQRNSAWRVGFDTPIDWADNENNCGFSALHLTNGGVCGICGESFNNPYKVNEPGPANIYATGLIFNEYQQGQTIQVTIKLSTFHRGYYEFRLCDNDISQQGTDGNIAVTHDCFNLLRSPTGESRFNAAMGISTHDVVLEAGVTCSACVFQWRYRTGNNWGCEDGVCGSGVGPQEEFFGCSDIAIHSSGQVTPSISPTATSPTPESTDTTAEPESTDTTAEPESTDTTEEPASTITNSPPSEPTQAPTTQTPNTQLPSVKICRGRGIYAIPVYHSYCQANCNHYPPYCPPTHCICDN